jgi:hypothetical protein
MALHYQSASAALVNWDVLTWTAGTFSNSYDIDPTNAGTDVTVTISGTTKTFTNDATSGVLTPAITMSLQGGVTPLQRSLQLAADLRTNSQITITVNFSYALGVTNVIFPIFDIDLQTNKDRIGSIFGIALDGSKVAPTITYGSAISLSGSGQGQVLTGIASSPNTGPGSGAGTAWISFGSTPIKGFSFSWTNSNGAPFYQEIAVGQIYYAPEPSPAAMAVLICFIAAATARERRVARHSSRD